MGADKTDVIEITEAMIEAGVAAYLDRDMRVMRDRDLVEEIFLAMAPLCPRLRPSPP
jgi:hypothetical protein